MPIKDRVRVGVWWVAVVTACGGSSKARVDPLPPSEAPVPVTVPPPPSPLVVGVALTVTPLEAEVFIDDTSYGMASELPDAIPLEPGLHQLVVRHPGYKPYRVELTVNDKTEKVAVRLEPAR